MRARHLSLRHEELIDSFEVAETDQSSRSDSLKRSFDLIASVGIAIPVVVVVALCWALVRLTSAGPGFYWQDRVGRNGRIYRIYKLRSMFYNCEAISGAAWSTKRDSRVTSIGRILRKLHLDELPQLFNVLKGDMSLVGPRPERPEFVEPLSQVIPGYSSRLAVRPGITGLAQIQLPPDTSVDSVRKKLILDRCYIREGSLWLDLRIILGTAVYLLGPSYVTVRRVMRLPNPLCGASQLTRAAKSGSGTTELTVEGHTGAIPDSRLPAMCGEAR